MAFSDDLEIPFDSNSFWNLDSPELFNALTENPSTLVSENEQNELVGVVPVSVATSDARVIEKSNIDQAILTIPSSFGQDTTTINTKHQSFQQGDNSNNSKAINLHDMSISRSGNLQRNKLYGGNSVPTSTTNLMTTSALQLVDSQHGPLDQSYYQPQLSQINPAFSQEPYVSTMVRSNIQEVQNTNGVTNLNLPNDLQNFHPSMFHEERYDQTNLILEQLKSIYKINPMQNPTTLDMCTPKSMGPLLNNQFKVPFASTSNATRNPEYRPPMITNTPPLNISGNYSPFVQTSTYQSEPIHNGFQNSSLLRTTGLVHGRPRISQISVPSPLTNSTHNNMSLVVTTQSLLTPPRHYQDKGKQQVSAMQSFNPTLNTQYQIPYTNSVIQQSGNLRQRNYYEQCGNEPSSSQRRRIMLPNQERRIADPSILSFRQNGNMPPREANHNEERNV